ncbi:E3 ubiquitin ligase [Natronorubrum sp. JWXQ-INN-674]|uniref:RING-type E3 ubiquitin transferase n=1 Tax=Natronorubrum halalkaliphilum TaxID=2691917 RepID=A0A6B0VJM4_9EURY|nr:GIDE domain-containing protein [Natronorubrum halalkaliphilum]MXV61744.1 E3 ubiquitin ligase [Natronorubrum halalkaliphilum]
MIGVLFASVGVALVVAGCSKLRPAYHVYRGDTDDVVTVERAEGPVELEGTASPIDGTTAGPLTGTPCLVYEYEVEEYKSSGKNSSWETVDDGVGGVPFRLEDETASVRVDPVGADLALSTAATAEVDGGEPEPPAIREFLETESDLESEDRSLDLGVIELATGNDRRYHERRLEPDEPVYVFGQSRYDVDARETMRDVSAVIEAGPDAPAFVIADSSQDVAARRLAKSPLLWIGAGLLLTAIGVAVAI